MSAQTDSATCIRLTVCRVYGCHRPLVVPVDVMLLWLIQSGAYMPSCDWIAGNGGRGLRPERAAAMWNIVRFPTRATHAQVLHLFFEGEAARYFAASAPTVHAGRAPAQRFTHPPQRAHCAACGAARAVGRNPPDGWTSGAGTWYCDTHAPAAKMAWSADGDKASDNADANDYTDAGDHNTAYADDANDPFAAQTDYISIFDAPDGREWTDLTYEEAKSLATRARAHLPDTQARNVLPEPTEPDDED